MVGATGFEPATTCTPTGAGTRAPGLTGTGGVLPLGIPGGEGCARSHRDASDPTIRMASTAPALRESALPVIEPSIFLEAGNAAARYRPSLGRVLLARAALQACLAEGTPSDAARARGAGTSDVAARDAGD